MRIAITGGTGFVGRFIVRAALRAGHDVTILGRSPWPEGARCVGAAPVAPVGGAGAGDDASVAPGGTDGPGRSDLGRAQGPAGTDAPHLCGSVAFQPWRLGERPDLAGHDALIHAGFSHVPGRYRGGEGDDPAAFIRANLDGSAALFDAAANAGVGTILFLSSRAVFDGYPPGTRLTEDLPPLPTTHYGIVKAEAERHLAALTSPRLRTATLRATGIYGWPGKGIAHKWTPLFTRFLAGEKVESAVATEVHADDAADAALTLVAALQPGAPLPSGDAPKAAPPPAHPEARHRLAPSAQIGEGGLSTFMGDPGRHPPHPAPESLADPRIPAPTTRGGRHQAGHSAPPLRPATEPSVDRPSAGPLVAHLSDLTLDRRHLLQRLAAHLPRDVVRDCPLPEPASPAGLRILDCSTLLAMGWRPGGQAALERTLARMAADLS